MREDVHLRELLARMDGRGYKAYKEIKGEYRFPAYRLIIDHVQGDPFAAPSRVRIRVDRKASGFGDDITRGTSRCIAACDFLIRRFYDSCRRYAKGQRGTGRGGEIVIDRPTQEVLERTALVMDDSYVEARFGMGLPAQGRRILGGEAMAMFFEELPLIARESLFQDRIDDQQLYRHIETVEDADHLRDLLAPKGLVGFVADGSLLPRVSGIDPLPLDDPEAVPFQTPDSLRIILQSPNRGDIAGMGVPRGVTLIVGGGYHGKSTLLDALELGVYNHIPGDGREFVVTDPMAVKIRAADGRSIVQSDISPFIGRLPLGRETNCFTTKNASGSTSQAANIIEALEVGARALLLDEDTSATNFMIRDYRMQQLVSKDKEPITPFIDKVRQLYRDFGVSTILVMGGSGDYFGVADQVVRMTDYRLSDVTLMAREIARSDSLHRTPEGGEFFGEITARIPMAESFNPFKGRNRLKISASRRNEIRLGNTTIDLGDVDQIVDRSQTRAIGFAMHYAARYLDKDATLEDIIQSVLRDIEQEGLHVLTPYITGDLACFRGVELAAAINRMRTLVVKQKRG